MGISRWIPSIPLDRVGEVLQPTSWLDWVILATGVSGVLAGFRRGLLGSVLAVLGAGLAFVAAIRLGDPLAAWLQAHWEWEIHLAAWLRTHLTLPGGTAQVPYSPAAVHVVAQQSGNPALQQYSAGRSETALPAGTSPRTVGGYLADVLAVHLAQALTFIGVLLGTEAGVVSATGYLLRGNARRRGFGWLDRVGGAGFGAAERLAVLGALLLGAATHGPFPGSVVLAAAVLHSRWAPGLMALWTWVAGSLPGIGGWLGRVW